MKIKENLVDLSLFAAIWSVVLYSANSETYSNLALTIAIVWVVADGLCNHFLNRGVIQFGSKVENKDINEDCIDKKSISNYLIEILILLYVFIEYFYSNISAEHLVYTVFIYSLLQRLFDRGFASLSKEWFEKLRLEEELDKEAALLLTMLLHQLIGFYNGADDLSISSADSSLLVISLAMSFYSGVKVFLETQRNGNLNKRHDNAKDNGTLGIDLASFCSRESQDRYLKIVEKGSDDSFKIVSNLTLAAIYKKMGLYERQEKCLKKIEKNKLDPVKIFEKISEYSTIKDAGEDIDLAYKELQRVTKSVDIERLVENFDDDLNECKASVKNLHAKPTKGFLIILRILLIVLSIIAILHSYAVINVMDIESLLSGSIGVGALFLIFKDFSLSIFSGLRIYVDNLFSVGDKLKLDEFNIVGKVINFNPSTVEIRATDNSITKIYMHKIVASTFTNLAHRKKRGRYINFTLNIDVNSITFLDYDPKLKEKLEKIFILKRYLKCKEKSIDSSSDDKARNSFREGIKDEFYKGSNVDDFKRDSEYILNTRDMTNIGTYREYAFRYLSNHNLLDNDQYIMVRQLQSSEVGVVLEIKAYTERQYANKRDYERIYSDVVEHLIAALPEFKLALFQGEASSGRKIEFS